MSQKTWVQTWLCHWLAHMWYWTRQAPWGSVSSLVKHGAGLDELSGLLKLWFMILMVISVSCLSYPNYSTLKGKTECTYGFVIFWLYNLSVLFFCHPWQILWCHAQKGTLSRQSKVLSTWISGKKETIW